MLALKHQSGDAPCILLSSSFFFLSSIAFILLCFFQDGMVAPVEAPFSQRCIACLMVIYYIHDDDIASVTQEQELPPMTKLVS
jgi:hypothetical protein